MTSLHNTTTVSHLTRHLDELHRSFGKETFRLENFRAQQCCTCCKVRDSVKRETQQRLSLD